MSNKTTHTQDDLTPSEWLDYMFEHSYCECCGLDKEDHVVTGGPLGNFFAFCAKGPEALGGKAYVEHYREVRGESPEDVEFWLLPKNAEPETRAEAIDSE